MIPEMIAAAPAHFIRPQSESISAHPLERMVRQALDQPIDYPCLANSIFAGDRVAIALQPDVPQGALVARLVTAYLLEHGVEPNDVTLVVPKRMGYPENVEPGWEAAAKIEVRIHDPDLDADVSHLGVTGGGEAIKINGALFDADVIIPIGCVDSAANSRLYPEFSTTETIQRLRPGAPVSETNRRSEVRLTQEHLGLFTALNVVAAPGGGVAGCFFGERTNSDRQAAELAARVWQIPTQPAADLIVVTVESTDSQRDWRDVGLALRTADQVCDAAAQILVLTEIDHLPPRKLRDAFQLQFEADDEVLYRKLKKRDSTTQHMVQILRDRNVFLKSNLSQDQVEELGLGFVGADADVQRLLNRANHGILLRDAHRIQVLAPSSNRLETR